MGLDTKDVDEVQKSIRAYDTLSPLFDAQKAAENPDIYNDAIDNIKRFEDNLDRYQNGEISLEDMRQSVRDAQNAVNRMNTQIKKTMIDPAVTKQYQDELRAIREEFGIHSNKQNVVVGISPETAKALARKKQNGEMAVEAINGMLNRKGNMSHITLAINPDNADIGLGTDDVRALIDRVQKNRDALSNVMC